MPDGARAVGRPIGEGRTAEVFEWDDGRVLKLYRAACPHDWAAHEVAVVRALTAAGVEAPAVLDEVEVEGRAGIVFERVRGRSLREQITSAPWRAGWAGRQLARLHADLHARSVSPPLPRLRERLAASVARLRGELGPSAERVRSRLATLPDGDRVCHYDFHPDNVLGEGRGVRVIDWNNAALGPAAADVARTLVMLRSPYAPPGVPLPVRLAVKWLKRWLAAAYEGEYLRRTGLPREEVEAWIAPVAAARLEEEVPGEREWLLELVHRSVLE
jgi:Ser/Thr protein kinase RdoA (MazF antagonist)